MADSIPTANLDQYPHDISVSMMDMLFGDGWESFAREVGSSGLAAQTGDVALSVLFPIFAYMNEMAMALVLILGAWTTYQGVVGTASDGKALGDKFSSYWTPVRFIFSVGTLAPVFKGLSIAQITILVAMGYSVDFGNKLYHIYLNFLGDNNGQVIVISDDNKRTQIEDLAHKVLESETYIAYQRHRMDLNFNSDTIVQVPNQDWMLVSDESSEGYKAIFFNPPTSNSRGKIIHTRPGNMGGIRVPCPDINDPKVLQVCNAQVALATRFMDDLYPIAKAIALKDSPDAEEGASVDTQAIFDAAVTRYINGLDPFKTTYVSSAQKDYQESLKKFAKMGSADGWVSAGMYYWTAAHYAERGHEVTESMIALIPPQKEAMPLDVDFSRTDASFESFTREAISSRRDVANGGFVSTWFGRMFRGMSDLGIKNLADGDPIANLSSVGHSLIGTVNGALATFVGARIVAAGIDAWTDRGLTGFLSNAATLGGSSVAGAGIKALFESISIPFFLLLMGLYFFAYTLAFYLPALPYILWTSAILGWLIMCIESLFAAPLWIAAHSMPEGEGMAGQYAKQGYMLLINVLIRPPLMICGLVTGVVVMQITTKFVVFSYLVFETGMNAKHTFGLGSAVATFILFAGIIFILSHKVFGLITHLPEKVTGWIGGGVQALGEHEDERRSNMIFGAAGGKFNQVGDNSMNRMASNSATQPELPNSGMKRPGEKDAEERDADTGETGSRVSDDL